MTATFCAHRGICCCSLMVEYVYEIRLPLPTLEWHEKVGATQQWAAAMASRFSPKMEAESKNACVLEFQCKLRIPKWSKVIRSSTTTVRPKAQL